MQEGRNQLENEETAREKEMKPWVEGSKEEEE